MRMGWRRRVPFRRRTSPRPPSEAAGGCPPRRRERMSDQAVAGTPADPRYATAGASPGHTRRSGISTGGGAGVSPSASEGDRGGGSGERPRGVRRWLARAGLTAAALTALGWVALDRWVATAPVPDLAPAMSATVLDRDGRLLRAYQVADGRWRLAVDPAEVDPGYLAQLIAYEDRRFWRHAGVDPLAMARAAWQAAWHGRAISGASTLTMQVARLLHEAPTATPGAKLGQIRLALALERRLSKAEILRLYLALAPFGGNVEGVRAASLGWFGKEPRRLTPAEAALLVALPQSPEARRPDRHARAARAARDRVLDRAVAYGALAEAGRPRRARRARAVGPQPFPGARPPSRRPDGRRRTGRGPGDPRAPADDRRRPAGQARGAGRRPRRRLGPRRLGGGSRRRPPDGRDPRQRRLARPAGRGPRGMDRHDRGGALARLDAQAADLRSRLRDGDRASGKPDRRPADRLRALDADQLRRRLSWHGQRARCAAALAERAGGDAARRGRPGAAARPYAPRRQPWRAAARGRAGARHRPRRHRAEPARSRAALRRDCARRRGRGAARCRLRLAGRRGRARARPPRPRSGRRLAGRRHPGRRAGAPGGAERADRLQDGHLLWPPRCLVGRLRRGARHRCLDRPPGCRGGAGDHRHRECRAAALPGVRAPRARVGAAAQPPRRTC